MGNSCAFYSIAAYENCMYGVCGLYVRRAWVVCKACVSCSRGVRRLHVRRSKISDSQSENLYYKSH